MKSPTLYSIYTGLMFLASWFHLSLSQTSFFVNWFSHRSSCTQLSIVYPPVPGQVFFSHIPVHSVYTWAVISLGLFWYFSHCNTTSYADVLDVAILETTQHFHFSSSSFVHCNCIDVNKKLDGTKTKQKS